MFGKVLVEHDLAEALFELRLAGQVRIPCMGCDLARSFDWSVALIPKSF